MLLYVLFSCILFGALGAKNVVDLASREISSNSAVGKRLLSKARLLADGDDAAAQDFSWMSGYSIKFEHCVANGSCNDDGCASVVHFSLCPSDSSCASGCSGGAQYIVDMNYFLDAFTEAQLGAKEYACEMARENCGDDEECYRDNGLDYCQNQQQGNFNLQQYLDCTQFGGDGDDPYYLGPYCSSDGYGVYLGFFTDKKCSNRASDEKFVSVYGSQLAYSATSEYSIVSDKCAYCKDHGNQEQQNGDDQADEDGVLEQCEDLYSAASGCEENLNVDNPDLDACDYIKQINSNFSRTQHSSRGSMVRKILFVLLVVCAAILGFYWCRAKKRASRTPLLDGAVA